MNEEYLFYSKHKYLFYPDQSALVLDLQSGGHRFESRGECQKNLSVNMSIRRAGGKRGEVASIITDIQERIASICIEIFH